MKTKDMPSVKARKVGRKLREYLRDRRISQGCELEPGQVEFTLITAYMAGYRHGRKMAAQASR